MEWVCKVFITTLCSISHKSYVGADLCASPCLTTGKQSVGTETRPYDEVEFSGGTTVFHDL